MIKRDISPDFFRFSIPVLLGILLFALWSCTHRPKTTVNRPFITSVVHPAWSRHSVMYEVNIRQYTPKGTFRAFEPHLARLKRLGVDIIWLMPVYPIGRKNRKGSLGSYYSIKDYLTTNPNYGTVEDLKHLTAQAHKMGFHVLLDWVANHTAWDHPWATEHPDWYEHDSTGNFVSPYDWTDVIQLDYSNHHLWHGMVKAMKYWVTEVNVDGFRCDYPGHIPVAFWDSARTVLEKIKPVLMLAEDENHPALLEHAFDMNYSWELLHLTEHIAQGKEKATGLVKYFKRQKKTYPTNAYRLDFMTNHDENSWSGTVFERYGDGVKAFAVLTFTVPGMPLIYSGQEAGLNKRLRFFDKDTISWSDTTTWSPFYHQLIQLKQEQKALWNGAAGGELQLLQNNRDSLVFSFLRKNEKSMVIVIENLSRHKVSVNVKYQKPEKVFTDFFTGTTYIFKDTNRIDLPGWGYRIFVSAK